MKLNYYLSDLNYSHITKSFHTFCYVTYLQKCIFLFTYPYAVLRAKTGLSWFIHTENTYELYCTHQPKNKLLHWNMWDHYLLMTYQTVLYSSNLLNNANHNYTHKN